MEIAQDTNPNTGCFLDGQKNFEVTRLTAETSNFHFQTFKATDRSDDRKLIDRYELYDIGLAEDGYQSSGGSYTLSLVIYTPNPHQWSSNVHHTSPLRSLSISPLAAIPSPSENSNLSTGAAQEEYCAESNMAVKDGSTRIAFLCHSLSNRLAMFGNQTNLHAKMQISTADGATISI
ncbi:hypothetical protein TWF694_002892 [Orbilia ellipsospora]|uniref:Uncharacterized protein n=1 Tax=Orbilia ellipsospora TaxID=2528407 RepID=A0AAV9X149_9PEZI